MGIMGKRATHAVILRTANAQNNLRRLADFIVDISLRQCTNCTLYSQSSIGLVNAMTGTATQPQTGIDALLDHPTPSLRMKLEEAAMEIGGEMADAFALAGEDEAKQLGVEFRNRLWNAAERIQESLRAHRDKPVYAAGVLLRE
jgi:hypothetical protein